MKPVFRRSLTALPDLHLDELAAHCVDVVTDERPDSPMTSMDSLSKRTVQSEPSGLVARYARVIRSRKSRSISSSENVFPSWFLMSQPTKARSPSSDFAMK